MKQIKITFSLLLSFAFLISCNPDVDPVGPVNPYLDNGFLVMNEGAFQGGVGTLSFAFCDNSGIDSVDNDVFQDCNPVVPLVGIGGVVGYRGTGGRGAGFTGQGLGRQWRGLCSRRGLGGVAAAAGGSTEFALLGLRQEEMLPILFAFLSYLSLSSIPGTMFVGGGAASAAAGAAASAAAGAAAAGAAAAAELYTPSTIYELYLRRLKGLRPCQEGLTPGGH